MIKVLMARKYNLSETLSALSVMDGIDKLFECNTIELPKVMIPYKINAKNVTCIPEGEYKVEKYYSPTKGECFWVKNVPGRTMVEIHKGNFASGKTIDTEGCILPGMFLADINDDGHLDVADSTKAMQMLLNILPDHFKLHII